MFILRLIYNEIRYRRLNFLLSLSAVGAAVALMVAFFAAAGASERETARIMLRMGFNLRILPRGSDPGLLFLNGFSENTMPEAYLDVLASQKNFSYNHLLATLQQRFRWGDSEVLLTGIPLQATGRR